MRKTVAGLVLAGGLLGGSVGLAVTTASAAPITCPGSQEAVKTSSGWDCQNNGGNFSKAENPKNPNAGKDKF